MVGDDEREWQAHEHGFAHRPLSDRRIVRGYCNQLIDQLFAYMDATEPTEGAEGCHGKHGLAVQALKDCAQLVDQLAGWAIAHQLGRAVEGKGNLPRLDYEQTANSLGYVEFLRDADSHRFELAGSRALERDEITATAQRQFLSNLIDLLAPFLRDGGNSLLLALLKHALEPGIGEKLFFDISAPNKKILERFVDQTMLDALEHIEYRVALNGGRGLTEAREAVAGALGRSPETLRSWPKVVRKAIGEPAVSRALARGRAAGQAAREAGNLDWSEGDLQEIGHRYRVLTYNRANPIS